MSTGHTGGTRREPGKGREEPRADCGPRRTTIMDTPYGTLVCPESAPTVLGDPGCSGRPG